MRVPSEFRQDNLELKMTIDTNDVLRLIQYSTRILHNDCSPITITTLQTSHGMSCDTQKTTGCNRNRRQVDKTIIYLKLTV